MIKRVDQSGEFLHRMQATGRDEIGQTSVAFNNLMESLQTGFLRLNEVIGAIADGDLSHVVDDNFKGELNRLKTGTNNSIKMLGQMIARVSHVGNEVFTGAGQLASSSQVLARGTTQQAAVLEEISSAMNEIEARTRDNSDHAKQAKQLIAQTLEIVKNGNDKMSEMLESMQEINSTSAEVAKVTKVIDEIAFQTNLLALNAAVEAARAGKYGKGFAVVADEVRNLAARSAEAVKSTTELIRSAIDNVENGVRNADATAAVLDEITMAIGQSNTIIGEISISSAEQAASIGEINTGIANISGVVQQNSAISEESASAAEQLSAQATSLRSMMDVFQLNDISLTALEPGLPDIS